jgi:calcineurin-like phosphoesterase family protein
MRGRLRSWTTALTLVALALSVSACSPPAAEAERPAATTETKAATGQPVATKAVASRIVAVGDVHGDYGQFVKVLRAAKVIDKKNQWIAGKTRLVQTGDVLDRAADSRKAMDLLMRLEKQAKAAGGAVHALLGNHEAMVLMGDYRYVHPGEFAAFGGKAAFAKAMSAEGVYGKWLRSHDTVAKVGGVLFVHAGLRAAYADRSLEEINRTVREELDKAPGPGIATDPRGPLWDRRLSIGNEQDASDELAIVLKKFGATHMVVAHTVFTGGIITRAEGRLIRIDVGMSAYYDGPAACLVIEDGVFYEVRHPDTKQKLDLGIPAAPPVAEPQPAPSRKAG